jgi:hypothetical protein
MPQLEILIRETLRSIDSCRSRSITVQEVSALNHEFFDHSVKFTALVALRAAKMTLRFSSAELAEVLCRAWDDVCEELYFDSA